MFNCVKIIRNGRLFAIVHTMTDAEMLIKEHEYYYPNMKGKITWNRDWAFIEGVGF